MGVDFVLLALLWISRDPKVLPGWGAAFAPGHVTDGAAAVQLALATPWPPRGRGLASAPAPARGPGGAG